PGDVGLSERWERQRGCPGAAYPDTAWHCFWLDTRRKGARISSRLIAFVYCSTSASVSHPWTARELLFCKPIHREDGPRRQALGRPGRRPLAFLRGDPRFNADLRPLCKYVPEPTDDLTIGLRLIRKDTLQRSQRECRKRVAAALQRR